MTVFQYDAAILETFPQIVGGVIVASGITNGPSSPALQEAYLRQQQAVISNLGSTPLSEVESLAAWRSAFRTFGVDPTQYRSAAEALLRRLTKKGDIPSINTLVDIGNMVSIRYGLPVAVLDQSGFAAPITVHVADGSEPFRNLNQQDVDHPAPGEVIFTDADGQGVARRWCWRQSEESAARETTTDIVITVEAHHVNGRADVEAAVSDLLSLLAEHFGVTGEAGILSRERAAF
jgi:DNA/RNA-binding domain of Phe-tRNA-synthetase-like protein